jgi:hypothetical protein
MTSTHRRPVQEPDRDRARPGRLGQQVRGPVIAVIDNDQFGAQRRDGRTEPRQQ